MRKKYWLPLIAGLVALSFVFGACAPATPTETIPASSPSPTETESPPAATEPAESGTVVAEVRQDLAERLNITPEEIEVISVEAVDWPDTSLGCPEPGMQYLQVVTPGSRIVLEAQGQQYTYHTGGGNLILCEQPEASSGPAETPTIDINELPATAQDLVKQAKEDLSERLNIAADEIVVESVEAVEWRDSSLGCPKPGMQYLQVITPGYRIILSASGQEYDYRTSLQDVVLCEP